MVYGHKAHESSMYYAVLWFETEHPIKKKKSFHSTSPEDVS